MNTNIYTPKLKTIYTKNIIPYLLKKLNLTNHMSVPKILSVHLSMCLGDAVNNIKIINKNKNCLEKICGQRVTITKVKKSISSFKIRSNMFIGLKVTLRQNIMWDFLYKFINIALPRIKDFKKLNSKFDDKGNITIGITDYLIFPEIDYDNIDKVRGMNVTIVTSSNNKLHSHMLLTKIGLPLIGIL
jgi:large subunit ribosomal protein L5